MPPLSRRALALLVLLLLLAYALRLFRLDFQSIWWDEGISLHLATSSLSEIARDRLDNIHPPLYFLVLKGWLGQTGVTAFTGRYLSVLAAMVQVPLVFAFTRYLMARIQRGSGKTRGHSPGLTLEPVAWIAAALMVISPLSIIYGQEIRVYALLPLVFIALLWLGERMITGDRLDTRSLVLLGLVEWVGLHLHYIAVFGIAYIGIWGFIHFARRRSSQLWRWIGLQVVVVLAGLPWFLAVLGNWQAVQAEASAGTFATDPVPLPFLLAQVWAFQLTGLAGALGTPVVRVLATLTAVVFVALVLLRLLSDDRVQNGNGPSTAHDLWQQRARLLAHWSVPLILALVVWSLRSFSHPRYVTMYTIAFVPLVAALMWPARRRGTRILAALFALLLVITSVWGLQRYFFNPSTAKADMRGVAQYLDVVTTAENVIVIPDTDWSLPFEYEGDAQIVMAELGASSTGLPDALTQALDCSGGQLAEAAVCAQPLDVYAVDYARGTRDWQNRVPFELERRGSLVETIPFDELILHHYVVDRTVSELPTCPAAGAESTQFGTLDQTGAWIEQQADANSAVAVALCWEATGPTVNGLHGSLTLIDPLTAEQVGQTTTPLVDAQGRPTQAWAAGQPVMTYHLIPMVPGTPPLTYDILAGAAVVADDTVQAVSIIGDNGLEAGQLTHLGETRTAPPMMPSNNPYEVEEPPRLDEPVPLTGGMFLSGAVIGGGQYRPGQTVRVGLLWQRGDGLLGDFAPEVRLEQDGRVLAINDDGPVQGRYLADQWRPGELVREVRDIRLPADTDGPVQVLVRSGSTQLPIGIIDVAGGAVMFERPPVAQTVNVTFENVAELVGSTGPDGDVIAGNTVPITLVWQSLSSAIGTDYAVFAHLVDEEGQLIGQHDGQPDGGTRPTSDWLDGEYILDRHPLMFQALAYEGPARIRVGLYDPQTGERLLTSDGADAITLPIVLQVVPAP